jgi:hypothetical protein
MRRETAKRFMAFVVLMLALASTAAAQLNLSIQRAASSASTRPARAG